MNVEKPGKYFFFSVYFNFYWGLGEPANLCVMNIFAKELCSFLVIGLHANFPSPLPI